MKNILVTTDFSDSAMNAALYATGLAVHLGARRLILYHSYDQAPIATDIPVTEMDSPQAHEESMLALESVEQQLRHASGGQIEIHPIANELPLIRGVELLADEWQIGLVVAATTGKSKLEKFLIGSNTVNLASSCPIPLLIVPPEARFDAVEKILFACDLDQVTRSTPVSEIGWWLQYLKAKLLVLHVTLDEERFDPDTIPQQYKMHELLDGFQPAYHFTKGDDIVEEIAAFAESEDVGLVITVPKSYGYFESLFRRSVSKRLMHKTEVPLLLLKEKTL